MADAKHSMKNIGLLSGGNGRATNAPAQYRDRKRQYFADATARFVEEMAPYATDFVTARMQGLVPRRLLPVEHEAHPVLRHHQAGRQPYPKDR